MVRRDFPTPETDWSVHGVGEIVATVIGALLFRRCCDRMSGHDRARCGGAEAEITRDLSEHANLPALVIRSRPLTLPALSLSRTHKRLLFDPCRYQILTTIPGPVLDGSATKGAANLRAGTAMIGRNDPIVAIRRADRHCCNLPFIQERGQASLKVRT